MDLGPGETFLEDVPEGEDEAFVAVEELAVEPVDPDDPLEALELTEPPAPPAVEAEPEQLLVRATIRLPGLRVGTEVWVDPADPYIANALKMQALVPVTETV